MAMKWQTSWQEKAPCDINIKAHNKDKYFNEIINTEIYKLFLINTQNGSFYQFILT